MTGLTTKSRKEELEEKLEDVLFGLRPKKTVAMRISDCLSKNHESGGSLYDALYATITSCKWQNSDDSMSRKDTEDVVLPIAKRRKMSTRQDTDLDRILYDENNLFPTSSEVPTFFIPDQVSRPSAFRQGEMYPDPPRDITACSWCRRYLVHPEECYGTACCSKCVISCSTSGISTHGPACELKSISDIGLHVFNANTSFPDETAMTRKQRKRCLLPQ